MRISDWSSDVCSSDLWVPYDGIADVRLEVRGEAHRLGGAVEEGVNAVAGDVLDPAAIVGDQFAKVTERVVDPPEPACVFAFDKPRIADHVGEEDGRKGGAFKSFASKGHGAEPVSRSEEHT